MSLTDAMEHLVADIVATRSDRATQISAVRAANQAYLQTVREARARQRAAVRETLDAHTTRRRIAEDERRQQAAGDLVDRQASVDTIRRDVDAMRAHYRGTHAAMSERQRAELAAYVETLRHDSAVLLVEYEALRQTQAAQQREQLVAGRAALAAEVREQRAENAAGHAALYAAWHSSE